MLLKNQDVKDIFELIEQKLEEKYQGRLSQKNLKIKKGEKFDEELIQRLVGCCIGIKTDAMYEIRMIKEQLDFKLRIFRGEREQEKLCINCHKVCDYEKQKKCAKWKKIYDEMWR